MSKPTKIHNLDLDRLQEVLDYNPETGVFTWLVRLSPKGNPGEPAGTINKNGYRRIGIDRKQYLAHQLAWFYFYGEPPEDEIDIKNGKNDDLRITNLRLASRAENAQNRKRHTSNSTGFKGVATFNRPHHRAKYRSSIRVNGKRIFLGLFHTPEDAYAAYCAAAKKYHGEFARTK
jgi:hypothetical protein